jgi:DNA replication and repair protein RecF
MRSCQARYFSERSGKKPILLLDDVLLELDPSRRKRFLETIPDYEQSFSAFLPGEPHEAYKKESTMVYHVDAGAYAKAG